MPHRRKIIPFYTLNLPGVWFSVKTSTNWYVWKIVIKKPGNFKGMTFRVILASFIYAFMSPFNFLKCHIFLSWWFLSVNPYWLVFYPREGKYHFVKNILWLLLCMLGIIYPWILVRYPCASFIGVIQKNYWT